MKGLSKYHLCGESVTSVAEPIMAAAHRSMDPESEWYSRRDALKTFIQRLPPEAFDATQWDELRRMDLGDAAPPPPAAAAEPRPCSPTPSTVSSSSVPEACKKPPPAASVVAPPKYLQIQKLSTKREKAFRCRDCRFAWSERASVLSKREQLPRTCFCAAARLPFKLFCSRNATIDLRNINTFLKRTNQGEWVVQTTPDEYKNAHVAIRVTKKRDASEARTVVLRALLAGDVVLP